MTPGTGMSALIDSDGYPTPKALRLVRSTASPAVFEVLRGAWWMPDRGVQNTLSKAESAMVGRRERGNTLWRFATGGWSGNEELIDQFEKTWTWRMTWRLSASGGLYIFEVPKYEIEGGTVRQVLAAACGASLL